jgi:hypothetical protein
MELDARSVSDDFQLSVVLVLAVEPRGPGSGFFVIVDYR